MRLGEILSLLRDAYCRTVGVEYMHIMEPEQKRWIQQHVEGVPDRPRARRAPPYPCQAQRRRGARAVPGDQVHRPEAVRPGRSRIGGTASGRPAWSVRPTEGHQHAVMGMAHRGRLNVLINIVGKSYQELFGEFEGNLDPTSVQGSGRRQVPQGFQGHFPVRVGQRARRGPGFQPLAPRGRGPGRRGHGAGLAGHDLRGYRPRARRPWLPVTTWCCP